ncbi:MAG TPA: CocE/NonD family hydrolase [Longimicrobiales bacterium]|nr:CocE/NonD family hydrolase [Longimicrobiales bacterium]
MRTRTARAAAVLTAIPLLLADGGFGLHPGTGPAPAAAQQTRSKAAPERAATNWMRRFERPAAYDVVTEQVMIPMRDGVRLSTQLYFPAKDGKRAPGRFPVLLTRNMNDSRAGVDRPDNEPRFFAARGYVVAHQTMRGRFASGGSSFYLYGKQQYDGADAVRWLASQPWSTGKVGTFGISHSGVAQYSLATQNPPGLAAMVPAFAQSNYAIWSMRTGGALELRYLNWATTAGAIGKETIDDSTVARAATQERARFREYLSHPPFLFKLEKGLSALRYTPSYEDWILSIIDHSTYPGPDDFWQDPGFNLTPYYRTMADVPTIHHTGWYDTYPRAQSDNWQALSKIKRSPQWLLLGPWTHTSALPRFAGDVDFGDDAGGDYNQVRLSWFDQWLRGTDTGMAQDPPVKVFVMGGGDGRKGPAGRMEHGGFWIESNSWPLAGTQSTKFYFHPDGSLSTTEPGEGDAAITYTFDPRHPVPTIGGNISAFGDVVLPGAFDQTCREQFVGCTDHLPLASRPDVLVFQTAPLEEDVVVAGYLKVVLNAASTGLDTDFTAKLVDVHPPNPDYPEGYAMNLADGIIRARFRGGREREELMKPGTAYEFTIEPYPTANVFKKGHRIRVDISSSNFPRFDVNPNTGEPILKNRRFAVVDNTVYLDRSRPSYIVLPLIPASALHRR